VLNKVCYLELFNKADMRYDYVQSTEILMITWHSEWKVSFYISHNFLPIIIIIIYAF